MKKLFLIGLAVSGLAFVLAQRSNAQISAALPGVGGMPGTHLHPRWADIEVGLTGNRGGRACCAEYTEIPTVEIAQVIAAALSS